MLTSLFYCLKGGEKMAKKKSTLEEAAARVLEKRGQSEADWRKNTLEKVQFAFFRGQDKDLEEYVLNRERQKIILKEINKI